MHHIKSFASAGCAHRPTNTNTHTHKHIRTHTRTNIHIHILVRTHTYTHTCWHIQGLPIGLARAVKIELFQDLLNLSPFFYGVSLSAQNSREMAAAEGRSSVAGDICMRISTLYKTLGLQLTTAGDVPVDIDLFMCVT